MKRDGNPPAPAQFPPHLLIGVRSIDREHQALVMSLDCLIGNPRGTPEAEHVTDILSLLNRQIIEHFESEENVMKSLGVPADEMALHMEAHNLIIEQFSHLHLDLMHGRGIGMDVIIPMIKQWIFDHLAVHDMKIRQYAPGHS